MAAVTPRKSAHAWREDGYRRLSVTETRATAVACRREMALTIKAVLYVGGLFSLVGAASETTGDVGDVARGK